MEYKILITIILVAVSMVTAGLGTTTVFAEKSPYDSGYSHAENDCELAQKDNAQNMYILEPDKGPAFHTQQFMDGYYAGWYSTGCPKQDLNHILYLDVPSNNNVVTNADDIITKTNTEINTDQEQNQAASTHQNGSCGTILIGDCYLGQNSENNFAANAEN